MSPPSLLMSTNEQCASNIAVQVESLHAAIVKSSAVTASTLYHLLAAKLFAIITLGMPQFLCVSLAARNTIPNLDLKASIRIWEAARTFNIVLLGFLVTALFKEPIHGIYWFIVACSMFLATTGLITCTVFIICFSGKLEHDGYSVDVDKLYFLCWTIWDLVSLPIIWTGWGALICIIALIVDAVAPNIDWTGSHHDTVAKVLFFLFISLVAVRFGMCILHLRRVHEDPTHGPTQP